MSVGIYHYHTLKKLQNKLWKDVYKVADIQKYLVAKNNIYYVITKGIDTYLLPKIDAQGNATINSFPMRFDEIREYPYGKDLYYIIDGYTPLTVMPEKAYTFKELVDAIAPFNHSGQMDFLLFKIITLASMIDRTNTVISTSAGFGKDSMTDILSYFIPEVSKITPTSMAALVYRAENRILAINEITDLKGEDLLMLQQFLSTAGSFNNSYENPKRGNANYKTKDILDISKLSISLYFNTYEYFLSKGMEKKYFDNVFKDHILDRFLGIRFDGTLKEDFHVPEIIDITPEVEQEYKLILRSIAYYIANPIPKVKYESVFEKIFPSNEFGLRHRTSLYNISKYIAEYTDDEFVFEQLLLRLKMCILAYRYSTKIDSADLKKGDDGKVEPLTVKHIIETYKRF